MQDEAMCSANVIIMLTIAAWTMGAASMAHAQQNAGDIIDAGKADYGSHCAACHGASGAGDGPYAHFLNVPIPNLTRLAERNGGAFPYFQVYETINGTWVLPGHGERNMPIWGQEFSYKKSPRNLHPEVFVRAKINALVLYIRRLQAK